MFMIGWTGDAAAASLTIDLMFGLAHYRLEGGSNIVVPHILLLASDPLRWFEGITSDHFCTEASAEACRRECVDKA